MRAVPAFGQFVPVDSPVHRLDAAAKIGLTAAFTAALFTVEGYAGLAVAGLLWLAAGCENLPATNPLDPDAPAEKQTPAQVLGRVVLQDQSCAGK
ncbi:MAG: hypothetical protein HGB17_11825 [Syntrophobacteraceae bacterium]|nr:hypothetical protein [Syntrophobacteraceae bacterium]